MSAANIFVPAVVRTVDSNMKTIVSSSWARRLKDIWWPRIVRTRPSSTKTEYIQWLLETARIHDLGNGGYNPQGDMMGWNWSIVNNDWGDGLVLTVNDIMDALGANSSPGTQNALEYSASWAKQISNQGVTWPQDQAAIAMKSTTSLCYDGKPFFSDTTVSGGGHLPNYVTNTGTPFQNLFYGVPFTPQNFANISAYIATIPAPDGKARKVKPRIVAGGVDNMLPFAGVFGTKTVKSEMITDPNNPAGTAPATNIVATLYETEPYIATADLSMSGVDYGTWWIGAELLEDDELSGLIFQERQAFTLRGLTMESNAELLRARTFQWQFYGRNAFSYGHPFLLYCMKPTVPAGKTQWTPG